MTCDAYNLTDTPYNCLFDGYLDQMTELQLGLVMSLMIAMPLYAKYEDPAIPAIGLGLVAGVAWPFIPAFAQGIVWVIFFAALTLAVFAVMYRVVLT